MSEERQQSEFNMAVSYLNRLNTLFYLCDDAAMNLDPHQWFHAQLSIFRELSTEMTPTEIEERSKKIDQINNKIKISTQQMMRTGKTEINRELYMDLHNFEIFLRKILKDAGLQNKMIEIPTLK